MIVLNEPESGDIIKALSHSPSVSMYSLIGECGSNMERKRKMDEAIDRTGKIEWHGKVQENELAKH